MSDEQNLGAFLTGAPTTAPPNDPKEIILKLLELLKQSSTWKGIAAVFAAFSMYIEPDMSEAFITLFAGVYGLISIIWSRS